MRYVVRVDFDFFNMEKLCCVLVVSLNLVLSQYAQSPCPGIFDYRSDGANVYGVVRIKPSSPVTSLVIRTNFTVGVQLLSNYVGQIEAEESNRLLQKYNSGRPVTYKVHIPVTSPLPRLTALTVNGDTLCDGPAESPRPGQYVTTFSLQHTAFLRQGSVMSIDAYNTIPQRRPDPILEVYGQPGDDVQTHMYTFNNIDNIQPWSNNKSQYYIINNTQPEHQPPTIYGQTTPPYYDQPIQPVYDQTPSRPFQTQRPANRPRPTQTRRPPVYETPGSVYEQNIPDPSNDYYPEQISQPRNPTPAPTATRQPAPSKSVDCGVVSGGNENLPLVYNGETYPRGDIPWLVAIYKGRSGTLNFICGGTLVSDRHVITAAHCMHRRSELTPIKEFLIKVGVYNLNEWSDDITVTRKVVSAAIHDSYNASTLENARGTASSSMATLWNPGVFTGNHCRSPPKGVTVARMCDDLLVLTFDRRVEFNNYIRPACLWAGNTDLNFIVGASGVVAGWGDHGDQDLIGQGVPRMVHLPIVSNAKCRASKTHFHWITSSKTLCAGDRNGAGPCRGDSGGGLYLLDSGRWRLRGIVSRSLRQPNGENICNLNEYIVFTDTAQYLRWIENILSKPYYD